MDVPLSGRENEANTGMPRNRGDGRDTCHRSGKPGVRPCRGVCRKVSDVGRAFDDAHAGMVDLDTQLSCCTRRKRHDPSDIEVLIFGDLTAHEVNPIELQEEARPRRPPV